MARTEEGIVLEPTKSADVRDEQGIKEPQVMATDIERGETAPTQNQTLNRGLQGRHMQMIAIGMRVLVTLVDVVC
jgi:amino acid permease